jgi:hypothetical protein
MVKNYGVPKIVKNNIPEMNDLLLYWPMFEFLWWENIKVRLPSDFQQKLNSHLCNTWLTGIDVLEMNFVFFI